MKTFKNFGKSLGTAVLFTIACLVICSFIYPLALTGVSQLTMPVQANGNLIDENGNPTNDESKAVGSALVGQAFTEPCYFQGRVSSINYNTYTEEEKENGDYAGVSSGSFNYGNSNPDLKARVEEDLAAFLESHPDLKAEDIPSDLLTASGSGLDPDISPEAAEIQIPTVAKNSGLSEDQVKDIVAKNTNHKVLGVFGQERVNVLRCNLDIYNAMK